MFGPELEAGRFGSGSRLTAVGRTIAAEAAGDINFFERQTRRRLADSSVFEVVASPDAADYVLVMDAEYISDDFRRRMRGVLMLVDARTGDREYRRRVDFPSISTASTLHRELTRTVSLMEEWAADVAR